MMQLRALALAGTLVASAATLSIFGPQTLAADVSTADGMAAAAAITEEPGDLSASKLVGASVYNGDNVRIGEVEDLIIASNGSVSTVVMGVGGFLGLGEKKVAVPFSSVRAAKGDNNTIMIVVEGTVEGLRALPSYSYASS